MHNAKLIAEETIHASFNGIDETKNDTIKSMTIATAIKYTDAFLARYDFIPNSIVITANKSIKIVVKRTIIAIRA